VVGDQRKGGSVLSTLLATLAKTTALEKGIAMNEQAEQTRQQAKQGVFPFILVEQWDGNSDPDDRFFVFLLPASLDDDAVLAEIKQAIREDRELFKENEPSNEQIEAYTWDDLADDGWVTTEINLIRRPEEK
jgi:hypothetical protein